MNRPPNGDDPGFDELDTLVDGDVPARAAVHRPAPRVQVVEEARTVVVAGADDPDATTRMPPLEPGRNDPTLVLRAVRPDPSWVVPPPVVVPPASKRNWILPVVVVVAVLMAFAFGGVVALWLHWRATGGLGG